MAKDIWVYCPFCREHALKYRNKKGFTKCIYGCGAEGTVKVSKRPTKCRSCKAWAVIDYDDFNEAFSTFTKPSHFPGS